jgi:hypothetical protein
MLEPMHRSPQDARDMERRELQRSLFPEQRFQHFRQQTFEVTRGPGGHLRGEFIAALEQISGIRLRPYDSKDRHFEAGFFHEADRNHRPNLLMASCFNLYCPGPLAPLPTALPMVREPRPAPLRMRPPDSLPSVACVPWTIHFVPARTESDCVASIWRAAGLWPAHWPNCASIAIPKLSVVRCP